MTYAYDARGRITSQTAGTRQQSYTYDASGNLQSVKDPLNKVTFFDYDAVGRAIAIHRPDGTHIFFSYDGNGNMTAITAPTTSVNSFGYNKVNDQESWQTPLSAGYTYHYDRDQRLVQTDFPSGRLIKNIYTATRLTQVQTPEWNVNLGYHSSGQLATVSKGAESVSYTYDGELVTAQVSSGVLNQTLNFTYNNDFDLTGFTYAGNTGTLGYDNDGLLVQSGGFAIARRADNGLPESVSDAALNLTRAFNAYGEVDSQDVNVAASVAASYTMTRDDMGRIVTRTGTVGGTTDNYTYTYDAEGRLTEVYKNSALVEQYGYNNGIRATEMNTLRGIAGRSLTYNQEDQILKAGDITYQHNLDGFLTRKADGTAVTTYDYSLSGELLEVGLPDGREVTYDHDPLGRRTAKRIDGAVVKKYLWNGLTQLLAVYGADDNLLMRFEYADARMPFAMVKDGVRYYLVYDQVGTLRAVSDTAGNVVKQIEYDSFGNIISESASAFDVPFGFAGGLHDRHTGLVRFGFRDYMPEVGRWTAKDPIGFAGGDTNLYGYVNNSPINFIDPTGELSVTEWWIIIGVLVGGGLSAYQAWKSRDPAKIGPKYEQCILTDTCHQQSPEDPKDSACTLFGFACETEPDDEKSCNGN